jgi:hypothetical protein
LTDLDFTVITCEDFTFKQISKKIIARKWL